MDEKNLAILRYIMEHSKIQGYPPTQKEIGELLGLHHVTVLRRIQALEKDGYLTRTRAVRSCKVTEKALEILEKEN